MMFFGEDLFYAFVVVGIITIVGGLYFYFAIKSRNNEEE